MADSESRPLPPTYSIELSRPAMGCRFEIFLNAGEHPGAEERGLAAFELIAQLEADLSVYRGDSELSRVNRYAGEMPVGVSAGLIRLLERCRDLHRQTRGALDVTAGPLTKAWGFFERRGRVPADEDLSAARAVTGFEKLRIDGRKRTVQFERVGMEINLGAVGKGYALDQAAREMASGGVRHFLIHAGQSSILARGNRRDGNSQGGWPVNIRHPLRPEQLLAEIRLRDAAFATSGSGVQYFRHEGRKFGHILDPRTGQPAEGVISANVVAPSGLLADALSTAFYVLGVERSLEYVAERPEIGLLLVAPGKRAGAIDVHQANWNF